jgi:hypothetical protein
MVQCVCVCVTHAHTCTLLCVCKQASLSFDVMYNSKYHCHHHRRHHADISTSKDYIITKPPLSIPPEALFLCLQTFSNSVQFPSTSPWFHPVSILFIHRLHFWCYFPCLCVICPQHSTLNFVNFFGCSSYVQGSNYLTAFNSVLLT